MEFNYKHEMVDLSICPLIACNMNCSFCYIDKAKFIDGDLLSIETLEKVLKKYKIRHVDVYGGEITLLNEQYAVKLISTIRQYYERSIGFVSNGLQVPKHWISIFKQDFSDIAFSVGNGRQHFDVIERTILSLHREYDISYSLITLDFGDIPFQSDVFKFAKQVSIKPYSKPAHSKEQHQANMLKILEYLYRERKDIWNKLERIEKDRDEIKHFFLMPDGNLYDVRYNENGEFLEDITIQQQYRQTSCLCCQYYRKCFNEHYVGYQPSQVCIGRKDAMRFLDEVHDLH